MKNLYFTVDMKAISEYIRKGQHTGFTWVLVHNNKNLAFTIITDSNNGISDELHANSYILDSFKQWIEVITDIHTHYSFSAKRIKGDVKHMISEWNEYMFNKSCNSNGMSTSVAIIIMYDKKYLLFQTGHNMAIIGVQKGVRVINSDNYAIGSHSACRIIINKGRLRYGDTFLICSNNDICNKSNSLWYIRKLIQKRRRYTRRRGRGIAGGDIISCINNMLINNYIKVNTMAIICCERTE